LAGIGEQRCDGGSSLHGLDPNHLALPDHPGGAGHADDVGIDPGDAVVVEGDPPDIVIDEEVQRGVHFAVCYATPDREYWDNNDGRNYTLALVDA
jgi:hypothetical protein